MEERIKSLASRIKDLQDSILTEEATKTSLIMPFFQILGYDVFNPLEFVPEFTADVGIKKGEKVDYAIKLNGEPTILIEAKAIDKDLTRHDSQLFRYFGTTKAKFGILTNGLVYKFYTDLEEPNVMDLTPFLTINLFDIKETDIAELRKFQKDNFDVGNILTTASDLKYCGLIKTEFKDLFAAPTDDFVKFILSLGIYNGRYTQAVVDRFKPIIKKSVSQFINDLVNDKIKSALNADEDTQEVEENVITESQENSTPSIETTEEELQSFYIVKSILGDVVDLKRVTYKDTLNYFSINLDGKVTKWICRVYLRDSSKYVIIQNGDENIKHQIESLEDLYSIAPELKGRVANLL